MIDIEHISDEPTKDDVMQAPPPTVYAAIIASMTPQALANLGVKLISVNSTELYWVTSVGQLFAFNNRQAALQAEYDWLMSEPKNETLLF
jgi:hypothetical protein